MTTVGEMPLPTDTSSAGEEVSVGELATADTATELAATGIETVTTAVVTSVASPVVGRAAGVAAGTVARSRAGKLILTAVLALIVVLVGVGTIGLIGITVSVTSAMTMFTSGASSSESEGGGQGCYGEGTIGAAPKLTDEQQSVVDAVMTTVEARGLGAGDAVIAVMTAYTESTLRALGYGDDAGPDSRGVFQQREPWGPLEVRMDPAGATGLFLNALTDPSLRVFGTSDLVNAADTSRSDIAPWMVAQSVQRSGYYDGSNYRTNYETAAAIVGGYLTPAEMETAQIGRWTTQTAGGSTTLPGAVVCDDSQTVGGDSGAPGTGTGPGAWGGYSNGQIPSEALCPIPWDSTEMLRCDAVAALARLNEGYRARFGHDIAITDSYRSYEQQVATKAAKGYLAAKPGTSNHGWGLALDLADGLNSYTSAQYQWMRENAPTYGWDNPAWARPNGSKHEPWHWEF